MANDGLAIADPQSSFAPRIAEAAFVALLLLVFIGFTPFSPRTAAAVMARDLASASGDTARQVGFLSLFVVIAALAIRERGMAVLKSVPVMLAALMVWTALSAVWADAPDVVFRRALLAALLVWSTMLSVDTLGSVRSMMLLRAVFIAVLLANFVSVALIAGAVHQPGDVEAELVGAWRGVHSHKNTAGFFTAMASVLFLYFALERRSWTDAFLCVASLGFLVMTRSKSSLGLLPAALVVGGLYRAALRNPLDRQIAAVAAVLVGIIGAAIVTLNWDVIARVLEDPQQFTGRAAIWQAELLSVRDHFFLGVGFGSFSNTGVHSPIYHYVGPSWVSTIGEGHGGYLELLVTIGAIGFALAMICLVIQPVIAFWRAPAARRSFYGLLFTFFFFLLLHNFMESDILEGTAPQWEIFLVVLALLHVSRREDAAGAI